MCFYYLQKSLFQKKISWSKIIILVIWLNNYFFSWLYCQMWKTMFIPVTADLCSFKPWDVWWKTWYFLCKRIQEVWINITITLIPVFSFVKSDLQIHHICHCQNCSGTKKHCRIGGTKFLWMRSAFYLHRWVACRCRRSPPDTRIGSCQPCLYRSHFHTLQESLCTHQYLQEEFFKILVNGTSWNAMWYILHLSVLKLSNVCHHQNIPNCNGQWAWKCRFAVSSSTPHCSPALSCHMGRQKIACILPHFSHPQPWWTCSFILSAEMELLRRTEWRECTFLCFNTGELHASTDQNSLCTALLLLIWVITMHFFNSLGVPMPGNIWRITVFCIYVG